MDIDQQARLFREFDANQEINHEIEVAHGPLFSMAAGYLSLQPGDRAGFHVRTTDREFMPAEIVEIVEQWHRRVLH